VTAAYAIAGYLVSGLVASLVDITIIGLQSAI
jgi:hypothetical protein